MFRWDKYVRSHCGPIGSASQGPAWHSSASLMPGFAWHHAASFKKMARIIQTHMLRAQQDVAHASSTVIVVDDKGYVDQGVVASHDLFMADVLSQFLVFQPSARSRSPPNSGRNCTSLRYRSISTTNPRRSTCSGGSFGIVSNAAPEASTLRWTV